MRAWAAEPYNLDPDPDPNPNPNPNPNHDPDPSHDPNPNPNPDQVRVWAARSSAVSSSPSSRHSSTAPLPTAAPHDACYAYSTLTTLAALTTLAYHGYTSADRPTSGRYTYYTCLPYPNPKPKPKPKPNPNPNPNHGYTSADRPTSGRCGLR